MSKVFSQQDKIKRLKSHYGFLFPLGGTPEILKEVSNKLECLDTLDRVLVMSNRDLKRQTLLSLILKNGSYQGMVSMNAYRLIDIFLGQDEEYESISQIDTDIVAFDYGYFEMENIRQCDLFFQAVSGLVSRGRKVWVFLKGSGVNQTRMKEFLLDYGFKMICLEDTCPVAVKKNPTYSSCDDDYEIDI